MSIIVAGGYYSGSSSVEILDEGSNEWQTGPELPFEIIYSQMVETQNGGVVLIGGESLADFVFSLDSLYQLPHGGQDAVWIKMEQNMQIGRYEHTAFLIPDNIVDCS
jgi:N-acetylneuraminic acid mutarotase